MGIGARGPRAGAKVKSERSRPTRASSTNDRVGGGHDNHVPTDTETTPVGELRDVAECPLPCAFENGQCDVLLRADDIVHDDDAPVKAQIVRKAFRGSEFLYTLRLASGEQLMAHVPSHHDHAVGESIGIRVGFDHLIVFGEES